MTNPKDSAEKMDLHALGRSLGLAEEQIRQVEQSLAYQALLKARRTGDPADADRARHLLEQEKAAHKARAQELFDEAAMFQGVHDLLTERGLFDEDGATVGSAIKTGLADGRLTIEDLVGVGIPADELQEWLQEG